MPARSNNHRGCLTALLGFFGPGEAEPEALPYRVRDDFLSPAELAFYRVLVQVVGGRMAVGVKVNLSDLFFVTRPDRNLAERSRIAQKHVDLLLCQPGNMRPILGIELDDSSHSRPTRVARDQFVDAVFAGAGLPLVRVRVQRAYAATEIEQLLAAAQAPQSGAQPDATPGVTWERLDDGPLSALASQPPAPYCPKCGLRMVVRTAGEGRHQGERFYGCVNYPKCREIRPIDARAESATKTP